jgi:alkanesulfonate monooxygenase SsuD/methylene tetrahydromethanopterin reductase-like flavin-dependent oxidoreductase (luciferase family)
VQQRDTYVKACRKAGRSEAEIGSLLGRWGVSRHVYVAPSDAQAQAEAKDAEMWYQEALRRFLIPEHIDRVHPLLQPGFRTMAERLSRVSWEQLVAETLAVGSPDTVADRIAQLRDLGVGEVLCWMNFGGLPQAHVRRSMELFAREVLPRFR